MVGPELYEKTIQREVSVAGIGLFTGQASRLTFCPAPVGTGIAFRRVDLPGAPTIPALLQTVVPSPRCTTLATEHAAIQMVEHVLSAVAAFSLDNLIIEVSGPEIPAGDGGSLLFVEVLEQAGFVLQEAERRYLKIETPVYWSEGNIHLVALPASEFRVSYTLHYPHSQLIGSQFYSFVVEASSYKKEIAPCRTFSLYEEIAPFIAQGLLKGGGLDNALVIKGDRVMNPEGVRFPDEMVRHKVLDILGDLALTGYALLGHIIAIRAGHASHVAFAKRLVASCLEGERSSEVYNRNIAVLLNVTSAKFRKPVFPGDVLHLHAKGLHISGNGGKVRAKAMVADQLAVEAELSFALVSKEQL